MKIINIITLGVTILLSSSCESVFEYDADDRKNYDEIFSDYNMTAQYLNTCYKKMPGYGRYSAGGTFIASFTDEAQDANDVKGSKAYSYYLGSMSSSNNMMNTNLYKDLYEGIYHCNVFIENVDKVPVFTIPAYRSRWKGEAYLLRAYYAWELIKHYGPLPIIRTSNTEDYDYSKVERPSFYQCVKDIIADCDMALSEPELLWRVENGTENGSMTRGIAYAIKSQAILYAASPLWCNGENHWKEAAEITKESLDKLLEESRYGIYNPAPAKLVNKKAYGSYQDYFLQGVGVGTKPINTEGIYVSKNNIKTLWAQYGLPIFKDAGVVNSGISPSQELVDAYETIDGVPILNLEKPYLDEDHLIPNYNPEALKENGGKYDPNNPYENRDLRLKSTIYYNGIFHNQENNTQVVETFVDGNCGISSVSEQYTRTGYYLRKFMHWKTNKNQDLNGYWSYYRLAEMYLNYAEAMLEYKGACDEVYDAINVVRTRAKMPNLVKGTMDTDELRLRLRNERRVEFAFEEHRYFDLSRWKLNDKYEGVVTGMKIEKNDDGNLTYNRFVVQKRDVVDDKYRIWPIPLEEELKYERLNIDFQNPGW